MAILRALSRRRDGTYFDGPDVAEADMRDPRRLKPASK